MSALLVTFLEVSIDVLSGGFAPLLTARRGPVVLARRLPVPLAGSGEGADRSSHRLTQRLPEVHRKERNTAPKRLSAPLFLSGGAAGHPLLRCTKTAVDRFFAPKPL
jgi:hypothetical protein